MRDEHGNLFWLSYADLMTALFIIALALFVLSYRMFKQHQLNLSAAEEKLRLRSIELDQQAQALETLRLRVSELDKQRAAMAALRRRLSEEELNASTLIQQLNDERARLAVMEAEYLKIQEIHKAIENLDSRFFVYQPAYKRHILRPQVQFKTGNSDIAPSYKPMLVKAGQALHKLADRLEPGDNIKYLLVIEGMASKDGYRRNYELSYERALSLFRLWQQEGIHFDQDRFEVMIAGSGTGGVGRDLRNEKNNQRFLIQIIPKVGELQTLQLSNHPDAGPHSPLSD